MWFDSHCHVHLCDTGTTSEIIDRARAAGVTRLLTVGIDLGSSRTAVELAAQDGVFASVGIHPNSAGEWGPEARAAIEELVSRPGVVAVGESGLDFYREHASPQSQHEAFVDHIALAKRADKTLVIHTRSSIDEALDVLERVGPPPRVIFHCWSGDAAQLSRAVALGAFISFAGNVSFKSADDLRARAAEVPSDRVLVETDAPFLTPAPNRGRPNEPRNVAFVGAAVAEARATAVGTLAQLTFANASRAFDIG